MFSRNLYCCLIRTSLKYNHKSFIKKVCGRRSASIVTNVNPCDILNKKTTLHCYQTNKIFNKTIALSYLSCNFTQNRQFSLYPQNLNEIKKDSLISTKYNEAHNSIQKQVEDWSEILTRWYQNYQDFVGITSLTQSQERVKTVTADLIDIQRMRRNIQSDVERLQKEVVSLHLKMSKTEMFSDEHVKFFDQARSSDKQLKENQDLFTKVENDERDTFTQLTAAISDCHEKEKSQAQNSKYWSIVFSVISAALASVVTSVNNWIRIKEIKEHAKTLNSHVVEEQQKLQSIVEQALPSLSTSATNDQSSTVPHSSDINEMVKVAIHDEFRTLFSELQNNRKLENNSLTFESVETQTDSEYSYSNIAATMGFGAAIGTIVTAFVFGSYG